MSFGRFDSNYRRRTFRSALILSAASIFTSSAAQELKMADKEKIDRDVSTVLTSTGAPSASIAVVRDGKMIYAQAYGSGRLDPETKALPTMRYAIGSVSKQFTAAAILLLEEDGKLSLDDKVSEWFPDLTRADDISLRQLLAMTSGYRDYWPQDYVWTDMRRPATADSIMRDWAARPLDFEPGTKWQYSNTNYVIAAAVVEKVSGMPFLQFLRERIFEPLEMKSVVDFDAGPLSETDAGAYLRNALGRPRPAPKEGPGWLFGAGQLAMTAQDLALWDIAMIDRKALKASSYRTKQTDTIIEAGTSTGYGLGVRVAAPAGRRRISHGGAVSGYTTINHVYPDDRAAIVVLTNIYPGAAGAPGQIADKIASILFRDGAEEDAEALKTARRLYDGLARGEIDRSVLSKSADDYFSPQTLADYGESLAPLGQPKEFVQTGKSQRGGMTIRTYRIKPKDKDVTLELTTMIWPDGRIDQYIIARAG